jgi:hypothetical protein
MYLVKFGFFVCLELVSHNRYDCLLNFANYDPHHSASQIWQIVVGRNADHVLRNRCIFLVIDDSATIHHFNDSADDLDEAVAVMLQYGVQWVMVMHTISKSGQVEKH